MGATRKASVSMKLFHHLASKDGKKDWGTSQQLNFKCSSFRGKNVKPDIGGFIYEIIFPGLDSTHSKDPNNGQPYNYDGTCRKKLKYMA